MPERQRQREAHPPKAEAYRKRPARPPKLRAAGDVRTYTHVAALIDTGVLVYVFDPGDPRRLTTLASLLW